MTVQVARPVVWTTRPPTGTVIVAVIGEPFCIDTVQAPLVVTVGVTPGMLELQELYVGGEIGEDTAPAGFWLPGAAGTVPVEAETLQVTVTEPALRVAFPLRVALKECPAGVTVVDPASGNGVAVAVTEASDRAPAAAIPRASAVRVRLMAVLLGDRGAGWAWGVGVGGAGLAVGRGARRSLRRSGSLWSGSRRGGPRTAATRTSGRRRRCRAGCRSGNPPRFDRTSAAVAMRVVRIPARTRCGGANQPVRPSTIRTAPIRTDGIPATPCWSMIFNGASGRTQIQAPERRVRSPPQNGLLRRHRLQRCQDQDRDRDPDRASFRDRDSVRDRDRRRLRSIPSCPC
ncbi:hypothetical protein GCM10020254_15950 [Streptomyces goshikiensis]